MSCVVTWWNDRFSDSSFSLTRGRRHDIDHCKHFMRTLCFLHSICILFLTPSYFLPDFSCKTSKVKPSDLTSQRWWTKWNSTSPRWAAEGGKWPVTHPSYNFKIAKFGSFYLFTPRLSMLNLTLYPFHLTLCNDVSAATEVWLWSHGKTCQRIRFMQEITNCNYCITLWRHCTELDE